jgi:hypothetical protein
VDGITITGDGGGNTNTPKYYTGDKSLRTYSKNTLTFTGGTITKIEIATVRNDGIEVSTGTLTDNIWTGSAAEVVFTTNPASSKQVRYTSITVTYE